MKCNECVYCVLLDHGYSNYTVEGTTFYCAKEIHPHDGVDHWYGENAHLEYAESCVSYEKGSPCEIDVDMDCTTSDKVADGSWVDDYSENDTVKTFIAKIV